MPALSQDKRPAARMAWWQGGRVVAALVAIILVQWILLIHCAGRSLRVGRLRLDAERIHRVMALTGLNVSRPLAASLGLLGQGAAGPRQAPWGVGSALNGSHASHLGDFGADPREAAPPATGAAAPPATGATPPTDSKAPTDSSQAQAATAVPPVAAEQPGDRYLHYFGGLRGQGMGNTLNGLWVAHILARRFQRTVCVHWHDFQRAFAHRHTGCAAAKAVRDPQSASQASYWNFGSSSTYAALNTTISGAEPHVNFDGNDWPEPQWPVAEMRPFLQENYAPTTALAAMLPEGCRAALDAPQCGVEQVMHLRRGDSGERGRGIFVCPDVFGTLRAALDVPKYAVMVDHKSVAEGLGLHSQSVPEFHTEGLDSWAEWVKILTARRRVYHTPSAFSESALRVSPHSGELEMAVLDSTCDPEHARVLLRTETWVQPARQWWHSDLRGDREV